MEEIEFISNLNTNLMKNQLIHKKEKLNKDQLKIKNRTEGEI